MFNKPITNIKTTENVVALTFDDGPHPVYTPKILEVLEKYNAKATFFIVGEAAEKNPEITKIIAEQGHELGNHSWNHIKFTKVSSRLRRLKQIWKCSNALSPHGNRIFRPPYGAQDKRVQIDAALMGYKLVLWNVSAQDWVMQDADEIAEKIIKRCAPGNIFLLHDDIYQAHLSKHVSLVDRTPIIDGLEKALSVLNGKYKFLTVSQIINYGKPEFNWPIKSMA